MSEDSAGHRRLDKWLWHARFYKTRSLAAAAVTGGKVHVGGERAKPSRRLAEGELVGISLDGMVAEFEVLSLPLRRGPATEARSAYRETAQSAARRAHLAEQRRLADLSRPRPPARPDKRDRRLLLRLSRDQS
ncbi:MAG: RNA-binding protein [Gammaproteobacteria bacterium]|nr:RNA-binding protein [Gammaproteobacteria bacterium]